MAFRRVEAIGHFLEGYYANPVVLVGLTRIDEQPVAIPADRYSHGSLQSDIPIHICIIDVLAYRSHGAQRIAEIFPVARAIEQVNAPKLIAGQVSAPMQADCLILNLLKLGNNGAAMGETQFTPKGVSAF